MDKEAGSSSRYPTTDARSDDVASAKADRPQEHVLVVEDSDAVAEAFRVLFEHMGRRVSIAPTVSAALAAVGEDPPDLILLDLTLPDGDGLTVARTLKGRTDRERPVVVALTGHDDPENRERCLEAGCVAMLLKPVPARELMARVDGWLAARA